MRFLCFSLVFFYQLNNIAWSLEFEAGIKEVERNNPELNSAIKVLESAKFQEKASFSNFFPKVTANLGTNYGTTSVYTDAQRSNSLSVAATENIFSGFSDLAKMNQAQYTRAGLEAILISTKARISYEYKSAYVSLLFAQKYIKLTNDILKRREANLRLVQLRFESGRENIGSLHLSKAYLAQAKYDHLIATNNLSVAQAGLRKVLGKEDNEEEKLEATTEIPVTSPTVYLVILNYKNLSLNNPDYQKAIADENFSKENITLLRSSFYPSLNLSQTAGKSNRNNGAWSDTWSIGAELSFPLFSGGKDYFNLKSSHESFRSAVLLKKNILDTNFVKLKDTFTKYLEIVEKLEVDALFVEAGTSRARIAKEKYNNGLLTFDEWDIIENDLITRQKTLVQTERDRVIAEALWEQVQGRGVIK